jgi:7-carboxy-7-deazaguanine synthase
MPAPPTWKITEIFASLQGEGLRQGTPALFIRFSGCNLECSFCDTLYARQEGREMTGSQILQKLNMERRSFHADWVCLTGGEPLLQDLSGLVCLLHQKGFQVQIETNATLHQDLALDWVTISPKPENYDYHPEYRQTAREVKLVVCRNLSFETIVRIRNDFPPKIPLILQPESHRPDSIRKAIDLIKQTAEAGLPNIRIMLQMHKILDIA